MGLTLIRSLRLSFRATAAFVTLIIALLLLPRANAFQELTNGGKTWVSQASGTRDALNSVDFTANGRHGWAVGFDGTILATADGGKTEQRGQFSYCNIRPRIIRPTVARCRP